MGASARTLAVGKTGDAPEDNPERAAEDVRGFAHRKINGFASDEREAEGFELKEQDPF